MYAQFQYYYSSATIAAVNRLIRHEAQRLEQQRLEQQQRQPQRPAFGKQQNDLLPIKVQQPRLSSSNIMSKVSPQQLFLRGTGKSLLPVLPR